MWQLCCDCLVNDSNTFVVGSEKTPVLSKQPIKSLGRQYTAELSDKQMRRSVLKQLSEGLARLDQKSELPLHTLQEGDVAIENAWNSLNHNK